MVRYLTLGLCLLIVSVGTVNAQTTAFTYQGQLTDGAVPANGTYDLEFKLFDAAMNGTQKGSTNTRDNVSVANGVFTVQLDFGVQFDGSARYLELGVRGGTSTGAYTSLSPRQALTAAPYALFSAAPWVTSGSNISYTPGKVGIGTATPTGKLSVNGAGAYNAAGAARFDLYNTTKGDGILQHVLDNGTWQIASINAAATRMVINSEGKVGIGTSDPAYPLTVRATDADASNLAFGVVDPANQTNFGVTDEGAVLVSTLIPGSSTQHICRSSEYLSGCSSAAEYVPTVETVLGYPAAGDLVSIAGVNPYGDEHAPFAVGKSTKACDENLVGFLLEPELGADGTKLNDHYLPLAIYGYFPANVTTEGGPIKRGDPITSSSTPGYGMKATGVCKIIGYALENADGKDTIQVFADHGVHPGSGDAALRTQVDDLQRQNAALTARLEAMEEPNRALEARLTALEEVLQRHPEVQQACLSLSEN